LFKNLCAKIVIFDDSPKNYFYLSKNDEKRVSVKEATFPTSLKKHLHEFISDAGSIAYMQKSRCHR